MVNKRPDSFRDIVAGNHRQKVICHRRNKPFWRHYRRFTDNPQSRYIRRWLEDALPLPK
jgi:hypothetical protein